MYALCVVRPWFVNVGIVSSDWSAFDGAESLFREYDYDSSRLVKVDNGLVEVSCTEPMQMRLESVRPVAIKGEQYPIVILFFQAIAGKDFENSAKYTINYNPPKEGKKDSRFTFGVAKKAFKIAGEPLPSIVFPALEKLIGSHVWVQVDEPASVSYNPSVNFVTAPDIPVMDEERVAKEDGEAVELDENEFPDFNELKEMAKEIVEESEESEEDEIV